MDIHSQRYKRLFEDKELTWEEKLQRAVHYADEQVKTRLHIGEIFRLTRESGLLTFELS